MSRLTWIEDDNLYSAVQELLIVAKAAKTDAKEKFGKNVIDPFAAIFEMSGFGMDYDQWVESEEARQAQKTLQNFVGGFHQTILGSCNGWENLKVGNIVDLANKEKKIIAEVKNKYNTISGGQLADLYKSLESAVMSKTSVYKGYTAYYVAIVPKQSVRYDIEFTPSDKQTGGRVAANKLVRHMDGASFYHLVTGDKNALQNLFDILPLVITDITGNDKLNKEKLKALFSIAYGDS